MLEAPVDRRFLWRLCGVALLLRGFASMLSAVPAEDGANYLWMASRIGDGEFAAALSEAFPPLWPALVAPAIELGLSPFRAGQLVAAICGSLAIWPMAKLAARVAPDHGRAIAILVAFSPLTVRFVGECYSEPAFLLVGAWALWWGVTGRRALAAVAVLLAAWIRPEGSAIGIALWLTAPVGQLGALAAALAAPVALAAARSAAGLGFVLLPKIGLHASRPDTPYRHDEGLRVDVLAENLLDLPGAWLEAFQLLGLLAVAGIWFARRDPALRAHRWLLLIGLVAIVTFLTRRRFLVSWLFAIAPFAGIALARLPQPSRFPVVLVGFLISLGASLKLHDYDRVNERIVGEYLAGQMTPDEGVAGNMTRVIWFAGRRPLEPRVFTAEELEARALEPDVRFVVLKTGRPTTAAVRARLGERVRTIGLPDSIRRAAEDRGILILERVVARDGR